jgi:hypothetical protein
MLLTELSVFKMSIQFFGKAFLRILNSDTNTSSLYFFIFKFLDESKLNMFRWKLFHFIIPNKVLLSKWKIVGNSLSNFCKLDEEYSHYFITCTFLKQFWTKFQNLMKGLGIENKITLKHIHQYILFSVQIYSTICRWETLQLLSKHLM